MKRKPLIFCLIMAFVSFGTLQATEAAQDSGYTVTAEEMENVPTAGTFYLSPDGNHIAWTHGKELCIYSASGEKEVCHTFESTLDFDSIRWSPDSKQIAFTENFFRFFLDPDIWVMDIGSGQPANLTEDNARKYRPGSDFEGNLDTTPRWSSDGKQLVFIRHVDQGEVIRATVHTIDASGGEAQMEGALNSVGFSTYALAWSPDGKQIAYNVGPTQRDHPDSGLWIADLDGRNARQLLKAPPKPDDPKAKPDLRVAVPTDIEFSPDGRYLLAYDPMALTMNRAATDITTSRVVAVDGSGDFPVNADDNALWATWSPSGSSIAYIVRDFRNPDIQGLYVVDKPGEPGTQVYPALNLASTVQSWRTLTWATNNTILVQHPSSDRRKILLLRLTPK